MKKNTFALGKLKDTIELSLLALPGAALFLLFCYAPMFGIVIAFQKYNPNLGFLRSEWVGLKNFEFFFSSQDAVRIMRNTLLYSVSFLVLDVAVAVVLAVLFYNLRSRRALKVYNTVLILPKFMSMVIIAFVVYSLFSPTYGVVNSVAKAFGAQPTQWYSDPKYWPWILIATHIWQTMGMNSIVYYAALVGIDRDILEAAGLDGASSFRKAWHIMVPHLASIIVILTILGIGGLFSGDFGLFYQVPKDIGMLYPATDIINTYTYRALTTGAMEKSAAMGLFQSLSGLVLVVATNAAVRRISPENSLF